MDIHEQMQNMNLNQQNFQNIPALPAPTAATGGIHQNAPSQISATPLSQLGGSVDM